MLSRVRGFTEPDITLEQYMTPAELAVKVVEMLDGSFGDLEEVEVTCDLGCGTGMLSIACNVMKAGFVVGVDIDERAINQAQENAIECNLNTIDFIVADVVNGDFLRRDLVHAVVMNPPFGTKRAGVDMAFLARAVRLARNAVYSMHKTSTRDYIQGKAEEWGIGEAKVCYVCRIF